MNVSRWELEGFASPPQTFVSTGVEMLFRAYSNGVRDAAGNWHGSARQGNCFFVFSPGTARGPIHTATVDTTLFEAGFLERNLNAALWENTFHFVGVFQLRQGVGYRIGPIGHETRGTQRRALSDSRGQVTNQALSHTASADFTGPKAGLRQVMLDMPADVAPGLYLAGVLTQVARHDVVGRERYTYRPSTHWQ